MSARLSLAAFALAAVAVSLAPRPVRAEARGARVLLVFAGAGDPVSAHLVDELVALGLTVEIAPKGELDLAALGKARSARAALRVSASRRAIELWVEGEDTSERVEAQSGEQGDAAALALRAVESLRGRLLSSAPAEKLEPTDAAPPNPVLAKPIPENPLTSPAPPLVLPADEGPLGRPLRAPLPPSPSPRAAGPLHPMRLAMRIEPALLVQPGSGGISAAGTALVSARFRILPRLGADVVGLVPVVPSTVASPEGRVQLTAAAALVGGFVDFLDPSGPIGVGVGGGVGAGLLSHFAQPGTARVEARDGSVVFAMPYARLGFVWRALPFVGVCADVLGGVATPRPVLRLPGRPTDVSFGQPLLSLGLGLEVTL